MDPDVAVMLTVPTSFPVTKPVFETVASVTLLEAHVYTTPASVLPPASRATAVACIVAFTATCPDGADTVMLTIGGFTTARTSAVDVAAPEVTVMLTAPGLTPVTKPEFETVATAVLLDAQVNTTPESAFPAASRAMACTCRVLNASTVNVDALSTMLATGGLVTVSVRPFDTTAPADAVMVATPGLSPVTTPLPETDATSGLLDVHVSVAPAIGAPPASRATA